MFSCVRHKLLNAVSALLPEDELVAAACVETGALAVYWERRQVLDLLRTLLTVLRRRDPHIGVTAEKGCRRPAADPERCLSKGRVPTHGAEDAELAGVRGLI